MTSSSPDPLAGAHTFLRERVRKSGAFEDVALCAMLAGEWADKPE